MVCSEQGESKLRTEKQSVIWKTSQSLVVLMKTVSLGCLGGSQTAEV